ncbi:MAG: thioesterase family protein [Deltaproteobacteria bacterium]|jgi:thioesterase-3|nr:thioesterase family protein [Deltaproteobacteria bacterium]
MYEIKVESTHLDKFGHVNNAVYLEYLEWARWDWAEKLGMDFDSFLEKGKGPALVGINVSFLKELYFRDRIKIQTLFAKRGGKSFTLEQKIYNDEKDMVCKALATIVFIDMEKREAIELPSEIIEKLS